MKKSAIASGVALVFGVSAIANGAIYNVTLVAETAFDLNFGSLNNTVSSSPSVWQYDDVANTVIGLGLLQVTSQINPGFPGQLFTRNIVDLSMSTVDGPATATSYECIEGAFGPSVSAHLCGNYNFGGDFINDSSIIYGPGTNVTYTPGGDDASLGAYQSIAQYDGMEIQSWNGTTLVIDNLNSPGFEMSFQIVPVPAAVWLFGSALGILGWMRCKTA